MPTLSEQARLFHKQLTADQRAIGQNWYREANQFCRNLAEEYGISMERAAAIVSVLSPRVNWRDNKRQAMAVLRAHAEGLPMPTLSTYGKQADKAEKLLTCAEEDIAGIIGKGLKTLAFWHNLCQDNLPYVTIDRWILRLFDLEEGFTGGNHCIAVYKRLARVLFDAASDAKMPVWKLQAAFWYLAQDTFGTRTYSDDFPMPDDNIPF